MTENDMQRAIEAFAHAHALSDPAEREAYLAELGEESSWLREEVESLLAVESNSEDPPAAGESSPELPRVPGCELLEELGRGGFGTVYRAARESQELEHVAIKVLQADRTTSQRILDRFQRERLLHARMKSQYVARVLDVGTTEQGDPYLMMELVEGARTLIKYAEEERLTIAQRLELFRKVCLGIEHLHVNGIYHRDLKPSNLLVGVVDGMADPKIIDFGLAKDDDEHELTQEGASIGTRGYMSPEQSAGEGVDLRTDIYSLGVILHELLTGSRPNWTKGSEETTLPSSFIRDRKESSELSQARGLPGVSQWARALRGDLDAILLKCLQHDRETRYQSASELRADIERHQKREPVLARGKGGLYALGRLAGKHRVATAATVFAFSALGIGFSVASLSLDKEREANAELAKSKASMELALRREEELNRTLDRAISRERTANSGLARAKADIEQALDREEESNHQLERFLSFAQEGMKPIDPARMGSLIRSSVLYQVGGEASDSGAPKDHVTKSDIDRINFTTVAVDVLEQSLQITRDAINANLDGTPLRSRVLTAYGTNLIEAGFFDEAIETKEEILALREKELGTDHSETLEIMRSLGLLYRKDARYRQSKEILQELVARASRAQGEKNPETLIYRLDLAGVTVADSEGQRVLHELKMLEREFDQLSSDDPRRAHCLRVVKSHIALVEGDDEATADARRVYLELRDNVGEIDTQTLGAAHNLSLLLYEQGHLEEAGVRAREAFEGFSKTLGANHAYTVGAANLRGRGLVREGRFEEAERMLEVCLQTIRKSDSPNPTLLTMAEANLAMVLRKSYQLDRAIGLGESAMERARSHFRGRPVMLANIVREQGVTLTAALRMEEAEPLLVEAYEMLAEVLGAEDPEACNAAYDLATFYEIWGTQDPEGGFDSDEADWKELTYGFTPTYQSQVEEDTVAHYKRIWEASQKR